MARHLPFFFFFWAYGLVPLLPVVSRSSLSVFLC